MTMNSREDIIQRVRRLSRMTIENGASETEAALAATKMAALIKVYDLQQSELTIKADAQNCILDEFVDSTPRKTPWMETCKAMSKLYSVRYYYQQRTEDLLDIDCPIDVTAIRVYGFPTDVAAFLGMCAIIHNAINHESDSFFSALKGGKRQKLAARESFELGMAHRLRDRIMELVLANQPPPSTGRGLIVLKDQLVTQQWADKVKELGLRFHSVGAISIRDKGAFAAGHVKGGAVQLHRGGLGQTRLLT